MVNTMISGGTCRLHYTSKNQYAPSHDRYKNPQQRRRPRRSRLENDSSQHDQQGPSPQPSVVLIQCDRNQTSDNSGSSGIILCKWLPTSLSLHRLAANAADDKIETMEENGIHFLEFDDTVAMFPKEMISNNQRELNLNSIPKIDGRLRSLLEEHNKTIQNKEGNSALHLSWVLRETDQVPGLDGDKTNPLTFRRQCLAIETDRDQSSFPYMGLAIPLRSPSVSVQPLQSLVISIVGLEDSTHFESKDDSDKMTILMQSFWKRQLVGKVIAFEDQWTTRIRLGAETKSTNSKGHDADATEGIASDLYAMVDSCTPLRLATTAPTYTALRSKIKQKALSLPKKFYMVLPSTYITIQPAKEKLSDTTAISSQSPNDSPTPTLEPPSPAAALLMETLDCIRSRGANDGNVPRSFLLSGPPGVGKTFSVSWAAKAYPDTILCSIRGSELLQGNRSSTSIEDNISAACALELEFLKVVEQMSLKEQQKKDEENSFVTGLVFLDECDALVSVAPIAAMLADLLDRVSAATLSLETNTIGSYWKRIVVVGATNRIDSIPSYLRRAGRFDRELPISPPSVEKRGKMLCSLLKNLQSDEANEEKSSEIHLPSSEEIQEIAELCVGYVAADLSALVRKAWLLFLQDRGSNHSITISHLDQARSFVVASALRDATLAAPPKITWDEIAGDPGGAKTALRQAIEWPRLKAREYAMLGLQPCRGILLHGPPGCAKTTLARAAAGSSGVAFLSLSPAQVYASSYVGEAERVVREAFHLARATAPCILFFDEIDSIFGNGSNDGGSLGGSGRGSSAEARVLSTFLNEMDGVDIAGAGKDGVLVLGATNRPWTLDPALLRPGRLGDKIIFLPPPDDEARRSIFEKQFANAPTVDTTSDADNDNMGWDLDLSVLVDLSNGMTGAEIVGACQEAKIQWMRECILKIETKEETLQQQDCVVDALVSVKPLLSNPEALEEFRVFENQGKKTI